MAGTTVALTIDIPTELVPDLMIAIAPRMIDSDVAGLAAIANKVIAGTATTAAEKSALAQGWIKRNAKAELIAYRAGKAAIEARTNVNDIAVTW